jgi:hypothetical protein
MEASMSTIDWKARYEALVRQLNADEGSGIYPMGHLTKEERQADAIKKTDAYKCGWNDAVMERSSKIGEIVSRAEEGLSDDVSMLLASDECFLGDDGRIVLNMNDIWAWATSWLPEVKQEQLAEVARLFRMYGRAGLMYWHSCQEKDMRSEFLDVNRAIDFVRHEEEICRETPKSSTRAYRQVSYTLGLPEEKKS